MSDPKTRGRTSGRCCVVAASSCASGRMPVVKLSAMPAIIAIFYADFVVAARENEDREARLRSWHTHHSSTLIGEQDAQVM